jgi:hypothetical protein
VSYCAATAALLRDQDAVALDVVLGELEAVLHDRHERLERIGAVDAQQLEARPEPLDRLVHDHVEAVLLGFEVVVERGGPDADIGGDVGPLGVLVAVAAEALRRGGEDLRAIGALDPRTSAAWGRPARVGWVLI